MLPTGFSMISSHGLVLLDVARFPDATMSEVAARAALDRQHPHERHQE